MAYAAPVKQRAQCVFIFVVGAGGVSFPFSSIVIVREPKALQISMVWPFDCDAQSDGVCASNDRVIARRAITFAALKMFFFLCIVSVGLGWLSPVHTCL